MREELTPEEVVEIEAGKAEIARGEWVDWDDLKCKDLKGVMPYGYILCGLDEAQRAQVP